MNELSSGIDGRTATARGPWHSMVMLGLMRDDDVHADGPAQDKVQDSLLPPV